MVFKRQKYTTTAEILDIMREDNEIMHSTSVLYFHRSDKVAGKIYLRKGAEPGLVYAAHVSNMPFNIGARIKPLIDEDEYEEILRQVGGNPTDPSIARLAVSKQLVAEKTIDGFIREYLFAAASEIFSWTEVIGRWENSTETRDFASRHYIGLDLLRKKAADRNEQYQKMIEDTRLDEESIDQLKLLRKGSIEDYADIENKNLQAIIKHANGRCTVEELRAETGLLKIPAFTGIHALWNAGRLQLLAGDIPIYPPSAKVEEEPEQEFEEASEPLSLSLPHSENPAIEEDEEETENFIDSEEEPETGDEEPYFVEENSAEDNLTYADESHQDEEAYDISSLPAPLPAPREEVEPFAVFKEEVPMETTTFKPVSTGNSIFDKLYAKIELLQQEINGSDERISASESRIGSLDANIQRMESSLSQAKADREEAVREHEAILSQSNEAKERLQGIIASIENLTAG
jgi:hypothetical protein